MIEEDTSEDENIEQESVDDGEDDIDEEVLSFLNQGDESEIPIETEPRRFVDRAPKIFKNNPLRLLQKLDEIKLGKNNNVPWI